jgi:hypothetical protein
MPVSAQLLEVIDREIQDVPIRQERWSELAAELNQLREAAAAALAAHDFDRDPTEFISILRSRRA